MAVIMTATLTVASDTNRSGGGEQKDRMWILKGQTRSYFLRVRPT